MKMHTFGWSGVYFWELSREKRGDALDRYFEKQNRNFGFPEQDPDSGLIFYIVNDNLCWTLDNIMANLHTQANRICRRAKFESEGNQNAIDNRTESHKSLYVHEK